jgi:hypothetical protein
MSEKDLNKLMELAQQKLEENVSVEDALHSLIQAGILDESGELTKPYEDLAIVSRH